MCVCIYIIGIYRVMNIMTNKKKLKKKSTVKSSLSAIWVLYELKFEDIFKDY